LQDELIATTQEEPIIEEVAPAPVPTNVEASWKGKLLGRLARFKKYPESALRRNIEGVVKLRFMVDASR